MAASFVLAVQDGVRGWWRWATAVAGRVRQSGGADMARGRDVRDRSTQRETYHYGPDMDHVGDLWLPRAAGPHRVAVVLHGGSGGRTTPVSGWAR